MNTRHSLSRLRRGTLQFVIIKPITAVLAILLHQFGLYESSNFDLNNGYVYLSLINNVSVTISLYCLVLFYMATENRLQAFNPVSKFLCIKMVVFFSFWQSCVLDVLMWLGVLQYGPFPFSPALNSPESKAEYLQNFLICIEMLVASIAHTYAFSYEEFSKDIKERKPLFDNLMDVLDVGDVVDDAHSTFILPNNKTSEEMTTKMNNSIYYNAQLAP
jgi:hypothetical protein